MGLETDTPVTAVVTRTLKRDKVAEFEEWLQGQQARPTVLSYISIFESLWKQADLYQQLENSNEELAAANEKLKELDKIQREFINVVAHELRTPIQPIP